MALNLANTITITAKTALVNVTTVSANVLSNATSSGQIHKINTIMFNNYSAAVTSANVTINRSTVGDFYIARLISVPANSILTVIAKDNAIYLEEGDTLQASVSANSAMHLIVGHELLS
jgi:hypothetical protein